MEEDRLLQVIEKGETQEVELKESFHSSREFTKLMSGFANAHGGAIVVGVNSKKDIIGVKIDVDALQQKISASAQAASPPLVPDVQVRNLSGKRVVVVVVQRAVDGTYRTCQGIICVRAGSTIKKLEGNQVADFLRRKQILCFDESSADAVIDDLDAEKIRGCLRARSQEGFLNGNPVEKFLLNSKLATKNRDLRIKNAATLFFAKEPEKFFPQIEIKLAQFDGTEQVKIISSQLVQSDPLTSIEKSIAFLKKNVSKSIRITGRPEREEKFEYPLEAISESIVNAVAHRDYFSEDSIQVSLFDDRIEVTSQGSLPADLPRELFGELSVRRNPIIYRLLRDYGYIEGLGSGIPRMIMPCATTDLGILTFRFMKGFSA